MHAGLQVVSDVCQAPTDCISRHHCNSLCAMQSIQVGEIISCVREGVHVAEIGMLYGVVEDQLFSNVDLLRVWIVTPLNKFPVVVDPVFI